MCFFFCPHRGEPDITPLFSWVVEGGKFLLLPRVKGDELSLIRTESPEDISPVLTAYQNL